MKRFLDWVVHSPRILVLGLVALGVVAVPAAFAQGSSSSGKTETYTIKESDYQYSPSSMTWHVGDTVKLTIIDTSQKDAHEFIMGKKPLNMMKTNFGNSWPFGWQNTLFSSKSQVTFSNEKGVLHTNLTGKSKAATSGYKLQPGSVELQQANKVNGGMAHVTLTFTVPNKVGTWKYACFEEKGDHYTSHNMVGTIHIVK